MIRNSGGAYREIALYHPSPFLTDGVKIPEAFIFIEIYDDKAEKAYFFPNLVAYEALNFEKKHKSKYLNYLDLFRADALIEYFYNPFIQAEDPISHMEQCNKSTIMAHRIYFDVSSLFKNMTEHAFPSRARSTLIKSIMHQSYNTAAILDFQKFIGLEDAINYYGRNEKYWVLDDRSQEEVHKAFTAYFPKLSEPIQKAYQETIEKFPKLSSMHPDHKMRILNLTFGTLIEMMEEPDRAIMRSIIGGKSIQDLDLAQKLLHIALHRIKQGDYNDRALSGIRHILKHVFEFEKEDKALELDNYFKDKSNIAKSIYDYNEMLFWVPPSSDHASDKENKIWQFFKSQIIENKLKYGISQIKNKNFQLNLLLEMSLILEFEPDARVFISPLEVCNVLNSMELMKTTLAEKKKLADFFYRYDYDDESDKWVQKIQDHFEEETTQANAELFAQWLREGRWGYDKSDQAAEEVLRNAACYQQALRYRNGEVDGYPKDSKESLELALNFFGSLAKRDTKRQCIIKQ